MNKEEVVVTSEHILENMHPRIRAVILDKQVSEILWSHALKSVEGLCPLAERELEELEDREVLLGIVNRIQQNEPWLLEQGETLLRESNLDMKALPELCFYMAQGYMTLLYMLLNSDLEALLKEHKS